MRGSRSIYANNANRNFCTKYGISTCFVRKGRAAGDEPLRKVLRSELYRERAIRLEGSLGAQAALLALKDKGTEQEDGNPVDFLWNTYSKCRTDDRQDQKQDGESGMT